MTAQTNVPTGHIVVVGANSATGRHLLPLLKGSPARITALVRRPEDLPADEVIPDWTNSQEAFDAIAGADTVIHLSGVFAAADWASYEKGTVATAQRVADAVGDRPVRVVYLSYVGADAADDNWYLRSKGLAEQALSPLSEAVVFRIQPLIRGGAAPSPFEQLLLQRAPEAPVRVFGDGTQRTRPIHLGDVTAAILAAVRGAGSAGTYHLGGPDEHSVADLARIANGRDVQVMPVSVEAAANLPGPPSTVVDLLARLTPADGAEETAKEFGIQLTPLSAIWPLQPAY
ncbi:SDR family oxidoreductase [Streptomyces sp. NPDC050759]|uniref:SDR family oxidoreductase n=1 Tax=Streptomyces sp. NPDC050759 TaxID=3365635 RepID=UPI00379EFD45